MVRLSLWLVVFEFEVRRSEMIFVNKRVRRDLLGVSTSRGNRALSRLQDERVSRAYRQSSGRLTLQSR
jgi:hypothetical protein